MGTISGDPFAAFPAGPFALDPSDQMFVALGRFSLAWSTLEMGLDLCALMTFHHFGGRGTEREAPRSMNRKIKMIRKCLTHGGMALRRNELLLLLERLNPLKEFRQQIAHGIGVADPSGNTMLFVRLIHDDAGFHTSQGAFIDLEEVEARGAETYRIAHGLLGIGLAFARAVAPPGSYDDLDKTLGKV